MKDKKIDLICKHGTIISAFIFVLSISLSICFCNKKNIVKADIFDDIEEDKYTEENKEDYNDDLEYYIEKLLEENIDINTIEKEKIRIENTTE